MPTKLYVGNLPATCTEETIRDLFTSYGNVTELSIRQNFAFVQFKHEGDAKNAVRDLNGVKLLGKEIKVDIAKSNDKGRNNHRREFHTDNKNQNLRSPSGIPSQRPSVDHQLPSPIVGNSGILHAVHVLAAVAENQRKQQQQQQQQGLYNSQFIRREQNVCASNVSKVVSQNSGYVISQHYHIDPKHPLLKGLPLPELPALPNSQVSYPLQYFNNHTQSPMGMVDRCNYDNNYRK